MITKSWKNHPQKLLRIPQIHFFFLTALTDQTAQTEEFMFQNVAYWPTDKSPSFLWQVFYVFSNPEGFFLVKICLLNFDTSTNQAQFRQKLVHTVIEIFWEGHNILKTSNMYNWEIFSFFFRPSQNIQTNFSRQITLIFLRCPWIFLIYFLGYNLCDQPLTWFLTNPRKNCTSFRD